MPIPFITKLEHGADLTEEDRAVLREAASATREVGAHEDLIRAGDRPNDVQLVAEGMACRYKDTAEGARQIMALLVPGDFCDLHVAVLGEMDHSIATLSRCTIAAIPRATVKALTTEYPRIAQALWWCTLVDEGTLREWLVNIGQRPSDQRVAHLFCELLVRLQSVGKADATSFDMPLTQEELGEVVGISAVHVNRTLQALRGDGLISFRNMRVTIPDVDRLKRYAGFTPAYLHLRQRQNA